MYNSIRPSQKARHQRLIENIALNARYTGPIDAFQVTKRFVINHGQVMVAVGQQVFDDVRTNEASPSGDQN